MKRIVLALIFANVTAASCFALNPQPLPPGELAVNSQPATPGITVFKHMKHFKFHTRGSQVMLNPQPLPPVAKIMMNQ